MRGNCGNCGGVKPAGKICQSGIITITEITAYIGTHMTENYGYTSYEGTFTQIEPCNRYSGCNCH